MSKRRLGFKASVKTSDSADCEWDISSLRGGRVTGPYAFVTQLAVLPASPLLQGRLRVVLEWVFFGREDWLVTWGAEKNVENSSMEEKRERDHQSQTEENGFPFSSKNCPVNSTVSKGYSQNYSRIELNCRRLHFIRLHFLSYLTLLFFRIVAGYFFSFSM